MKDIVFHIISCFILVGFISCASEWNQHVFEDETRFMDTGASVAVYNNILVVGTRFILREEGGYLTIYEKENDLWILKTTFDMKKIFPGYWFPDKISVSDTIIAASARYVKGRNFGNEQAVFIFEKQYGVWGFVGAIHGEDYDYISDGGFASDISVDKNVLMIVAQGNDSYFEATGRSLDPYTPNTMSSLCLYTIENGKIREDLIIPVFIYGSGIGYLKNDKILFTSNALKKENGEIINRGSSGRINIYKKHEEIWELDEMLDQINTPEISIPSFSQQFIGISNSTIFVAYHSNVYMLKKEENSWIVEQIIVLSDEIKNHLNREINPYLNDIVIDDDIMAVSWSRGFHKFVYIYRYHNNRWNITDIINLNKYGFSYSAKLSLSKNTLVIGLNQANFTVQSSDTNAYFPWLPIFFKKNPGKVCVMELLPQRGHTLKNTITRNYTRDREVRWKIY
jgi:hypothetical protein